MAASVWRAANDAAGLEFDRPIVQSARRVKVRADQRLTNDGGAGERGHALRNDLVRAVADRRGPLRIRPGRFVSYLYHPFVPPGGQSIDRICLNAPISTKDLEMVTPTGIEPVLQP